MDLTPFEGRDTEAVGIEIRNAAGGLNEALSVDPAEWHRDEEVTVVLRCNVDKIRFDPVKDSDGNRRVHILTANAATVVDGDIVKEQLEEQQRRIEEAKGVERLPFDEGLAADLSAAHEAGAHRELAPGCPECDAEAEAAVEDEGAA